MFSPRVVIFVPPGLVGGRAGSTLNLCWRIQGCVQGKHDLSNDTFRGKWITSRQSGRSNDESRSSERPTMLKIAEGRFS